MCKVWESVWIVWMSLLLKESHCWFAAWFLLVLVREPLASWSFTEAACRLWEKMAATDLVAFCQLIRLNSQRHWSLLFGKPSMLEFRAEHFCAVFLGLERPFGHLSECSEWQKMFWISEVSAYRLIYFWCRQLHGSYYCLFKARFPQAQFLFNLLLLHFLTIMKIVVHLSIKVCLCQRLPRALQCHSCIAYAAHRHWSLGLA